MALEAARNKAIESGINALIIDDQLQGDVKDVAEYMVRDSLKLKQASNEPKPVCLLFGGETTVKMTGKGKGGRNQHLALVCSQYCYRITRVSQYSASGPTAMMVRQMLQEP